MNPDQSARSAPLTPLSFHILLTLATGQAHGYGIGKAIEERTRARLRPGTGTLHSALQRLMTDGLVEPSADPPPTSDGRRRSYYSLTEAGVDAFRAETVRLANLVGTAVDTKLVPELERALGAIKD